MATVLQRREFDQDGISFTMLTGLFAIAVAVEASPTVCVSEAATRQVGRSRDDGVLSPDYLLGLDFRGTKEPDEEASVALYELCVYVACKSLQESAVASAEAFLDEVDAAVPEAFAIATFSRHSVNK